MRREREFENTRTELMIYWLDERLNNLKLKCRIFKFKLGKSTALFKTTPAQLHSNLD